MKILIVTNMYPSQGDVSWRGSFVKDQVDAYKATYPEVEIDVFHIKGKISGGSNYNYIKQLPKLIAKLLFGRFDIVHCHHAFCVLMCVPWFYRLSYTVHEGELNNKKIRSSLISLAIHLSKVAIFVSRHEYQRHGTSRKRFLPCGLDLNDFTPATDRDSVRRFLGLPLQKKIILFPADPARVEKNGGILRQVEVFAAELRRDWHFVYGGKIPKEDMPKWMAAADVVVSIGEFESDGMVVKEAVACNVPVLSTDVGNSKYYIDENCGVIIPKATKHLVFNGLEKILGDLGKFSGGRARMLKLRQDHEAVSRRLNSIYIESLSE